MKIEPTTIALNSTVLGTITALCPDGLTVLLAHGVFAFLPSSALPPGNMAPLNELIGRTVHCTVKKTNSNTSRVVTIACDYIEVASDEMRSRMTAHKVSHVIKQPTHTKVLSNVMPVINNPATNVTTDQKVKENCSAGVHAKTKVLVQTILSLNELLTLVHQEKPLPILSAACETPFTQCSVQAVDTPIPPDHIDIDKIPAELRNIAVSLDDNNCDIDIELVRDLLKQRNAGHIREIAIVAELLVLYACVRLAAAKRLTARYSIHLDDWRDRNRDLLNSSGLPSSILSTLDEHLLALKRIT